MSRCDRCNDDRWIEVVVDGVARMRRCECFERVIHQRRRRRIAASLPPKFRNVALAQNPIARLPTPQVSAIRRFHDELGRHLDRGRGLWLDGPTGIGKSAVAALLVKRAEDLGRSTLFCEVPELLNSLRRTYREDARLEDEQLYETLTEADLLVLDDLGAPRASDWALEQLFIFINARYKTERAVVVTTDLTPQQLARQINWRTVRRLYDICGDPLTLSFPEAPSEDVVRSTDRVPLFK